MVKPRPALRSPLLPPLPASLRALEIPLTQLLAVMSKGIPLPGSLERTGPDELESFSEPSDRLFPTEAEL